MTLSVACYTHHPGPQVAALLGQLRHVADEIVVAVDARIDPAHLGAYAPVADRLFRYEHTGANRALAWLHAQCSSEWILRLDGDEVVSEALVAQLRTLITTREVAQYFLPRRWLFPDAGHWLNELPWYPDFQNRLVHNDSRLWFPGLKHTGAAPASPARYLEDAPIYHLDLLTPFEERLSKATGYEEHHSGSPAPGGGPINEVYYLPERHARLEPSVVPAEDQQRIGEVLAGSPKRVAAPADVPLVTAAEVERHWNGRIVHVEAYRATIVPVERDQLMHPGERRALHVRVTNEGIERWPWGEEQLPQIRASYHWLDRAGNLLVWEGLRTPFPAPVGPGESCVVPLVVTAPDNEGTYVLEVDLVHEQVRWFDCPVRIEVTIASFRCPPADRHGPPIARARHALAHIAVLALAKAARGSPVPISRLTKVRELAAERDALTLYSSKFLRSGAILEDPALARRLPSPELGEWSLAASTLNWLGRRIQERQPRAILELGSGLSTACLAHYMSAVHANPSHPLVFSVDEKKDLADRTAALVDALHLDEYVKIGHAPLRALTVGREETVCYDLSEEFLGDLLDGVRPDFVVIDGPSAASGASRFGTLPLVLPMLAPGALFFLDDALRDAELEVAAVWSELAGVQVEGIYLVGKGLLTGQVRPTA